MNSLLDEDENYDTSRYSDGFRWVKLGIWIYFWLLIIEGSLRKWILPSLSSPLILIRDPVLIYIYWEAWKLGLFKRDKTSKHIFLTALVFLVVSCVSIITNQHRLLYESDLSKIFIISLYGLRSNFFHLPLIFLMGRALTQRDVIYIGKWILLITIPISILMVMQFYSPTDHILNVGAGGEEGAQITAALDKIRPPGPFSFITGINGFLPIASAFLFYGLVQSKIYSRGLLILSAIAIVTAITVSISRGLLILVSLVVVNTILMFILNPKLVTKSQIRNILLSVFAFISMISLLLYFNTTDYLDSILGVFNTRIQDAGRAEGGLTGFWERGLSMFNPLVKYGREDPIPILGYGLGLGSNVASSLLLGDKGFLLAEEEWHRILQESGIILGVFYIGLRVNLVITMAIKSYISLRRGMILPWLLFSSVFMGLLNGQLSRSETLGFVIVGSGLCWASFSCLSPRARWVRNYLTDNQEEQ